MVIKAKEYVLSIKNKHSGTIIYKRLGMKEIKDVIHKNRINFGSTALLSKTPALLLDSALDGAFIPIKSEDISYIKLTAIT